MTAEAQHPHVHPAAAADDRHVAGNRTVHQRAALGGQRPLRVDRQITREQHGARLVAKRAHVDQAITRVSTDDATLEGVLERFWGYTSFKPLQREAMEAVLARRDSIVVLPTGGGKSLCFQAPALVRPGLTLVVSPLISLMKDQVDTLVGERRAGSALQQLARRATRRRRSLAGMREGRYRLLYVSPERLVGEGSDGFVSLLVLAQRWQLRRDRRGALHQPVGARLPARVPAARTAPRAAGRAISLHAYTATATARVRHDIAAQLALENPRELVGSLRPAEPCSIACFRAAPEVVSSRDILARHRDEAGIIYCVSRREVEALAAWLSATGVPALPYHAGLSDAERRPNQDAFLDERTNVIVATVAFGMGIDRSDVRFVVHAGAPRSVEHYQQESGRAGRDGLDAECVLISSAADFMKWRVMLERNGELTEGNAGLLRQMERYVTSVGCRHRHLAEYFGDTDVRREPGGCGVVRLLSRRARSGFSADHARPQDPLVRRPGRAAVRRDACHERASRAGDRAGARAVARSAQHVRPAGRAARRRDPRLHRAADGAGAAAADRRCTTRC